jgi:hypothetical protein
MSPFSDKAKATDEAIVRVGPNLVGMEFSQRYGIELTSIRFAMSEESRPLLKVCCGNPIMGTVGKDHEVAKRFMALVKEAGYDLNEDDFEFAPDFNDLHICSNLDRTLY